MIISCPYNREKLCELDSSSKRFTVWSEKRQKEIEVCSFCYYDNYGDDWKEGQDPWDKSL